MHIIRNTAIQVFILILISTNCFSQETDSLHEQDTFLFSYEHLFNTYSKEDIKTWTQTLDYFVFIRAYEGLANDADQFLMALQYDSIADINKYALAIGFEIPDNVEKFIQKGKIAKYRSLGTQNFLGYDWFIYLSDKNIIFQPTNCKPFFVCTEDFEACKKMEEILNSSGLQNTVNKEQVLSPNAVTKEKYGNWLR